MQEELRHHNTKISAICLQETWIQSGALDVSLFDLPGYQTFALSAQCGAHGGLITYISDEYTVSVRDLYRPSKLWEGLFLQITGPNIKPLTLGNIYRPPRRNNNNEIVEMFLKEYRPIISQLAKEQRNAIITGDFNLNLTVMHNREKFAEFFDLMVNHGFLPKICFPTRFANRTASLLDQIYIKEYNISAADASAILYSAISDHLACISGTQGIKTQTKHPRHVIIEDKSETSINSSITEIESANILEKLDNNLLQDPNITYQIIDNIIQEAKNKHIPTKKVKFNKYKHGMTEWITPGLLHSIHFKDQLYAKLNRCSKNSPNYNTLKINYNTYSRILKKSITSAKKKYYDTEFHKHCNDMKNTWKTINIILNRGKKKQNIAYLNTTKGKITDKQEIASALNSFFAKIGTDLASTLPQPSAPYTAHLKKSISFSFSFNLTTPFQITKIINSLKPKTSSGYDGISMKMLKQLNACLSGPISLLTNQSLTTGIFPDKFKLAKILPLQKKNEQQ